MKKTILFFGFAGLFIFSLGYTDDAGIEPPDVMQLMEQNTPLAQEEAILPQQDDLSHNEVVWGFMSQKGKTKAKLAEAPEEVILDKKGKPQAVKNQNDLTQKGGWLVAEFLYWKPYVSGTPIGIKTELGALGDPANQVAVTPKEHHINYSFHPGFRAGLGCRLPYDHWDLAAVWTQLDAHGRKTLTRTGTKFVGTVWSPLTPIGNPVALYAKGDIHLKVADLELGKVFYPSRSFSLRPTIGARGTWIDQGMKLTYMEATGSNNDSTGNDHLHIRNRYQAGGLRGALAALWHIKHGIGFYGKAGFSLLWGKFKATINEHITGRNTSSGTIIDTTMREANNFNALKSVFDLTGGMSWTRVFSPKVRLCLYVDYEFNYWPNMQENKIYANSGAPGATYPIKIMGDIGFQGFNAGVRIDF
jgi:hypothetical protein